MKGLKGGQAHFRCLLRSRQSLVYQVKADVRGPDHCCRSGRRSHAPLTAFAPPRSRTTGCSSQSSYNVAVTVTSKKIHPAVNTAGASWSTPSTTLIFRRTRASPLHPGNGGCRCCCSSRPGQRPAAGSPTAPTAQPSVRIRRGVAQSRSAEADRAGAVPSACAQVPQQTSLPSAGPTAPYPRSPKSGSSGFFSGLSHQAAQ